MLLSPQLLMAFSHDVLLIVRFSYFCWAGYGPLGQDTVVHAVSTKSFNLCPH